MEELVWFVQWFGFLFRKIRVMLGISIQTREEEKTNISVVYKKNKFIN